MENIEKLSEHYVLLYVKAAVDSKKCKNFYKKISLPEKEGLKEDMYYCISLLSLPLLSFFLFLFY